MKYLNLDIDSTLGGDNASDSVISSQKALKTYIDNNASDKTFIATYNSTSYNEVTSALNGGKVVFLEDQGNGVFASLVYIGSGEYIFSSTEALGNVTYTLTFSNDWILDSYSLASGDVAYLTNQASGTNSIAIGKSSGGSYSVILGNSASVNNAGSYSTVLGYSAKAGAVSGAIQIGYGTNSTANSLSIGFYNNSSTHYNWQLLDGTTGKIPNDRINTTDSISSTGTNPLTSKGAYNNLVSTVEAGTTANVIKVTKAGTASTITIDNVANATTASKLGSTDVGSATQPIYLDDGTATACTYELNKSVPSDAVFTDTTYSNGTGITIGTGNAINHSNSVTAATAGTSSATSGSTLAVPYVTYDAQGHITASGTHTHTVSGFVPTSRTVNSKALSSDITLDASDVGALANTTTLDDLVTTTQKAALNSGATSTNIGQISTNTSNISDIQGMIPSEASSNNKLADKSFVNSSISTNTANFIGTFSSVSELNAYSGTKTNNDYAFVTSTDTAGNTVYNRYKYNSSTQTWVFEYALNNSSFTAAQWSTINSGVTSDTKVTHTASTKIGDTNKPVYIAATGAATACTYELNKSVPSDAVFTDTTYSVFTGANGTTAGTAGLVKAPAATDNTKFLKGDGTWATINMPSEVTETTVSGWGFTKNTGTVVSVNGTSPDSNGDVTLSIPSTTSSVTSGSTAALTSGGAYTNLVRRLSTSAATGSASQGIYIDANGQVQTCNAVTSNYSSTGTAPVNGTAVASALSNVPSASMITTQDIITLHSGGIALVNNKSMYKHTLVGDTTYIFNTTNLNITSSEAYTFELYVVMNAVYTLTFPESLTWQGGEAPDMSSTGTYFFAFRTVDGGTTWLGNLQGIW